MSLQNFSEVCYTCTSCSVSKKVCKLKRKPIGDIYKDCCSDYSERKMETCLLCGTTVINLPQHVSQAHQQTMSAYRVLTADKDPSQLNFRRKSLWE